MRWRAPSWLHVVAGLLAGALMPACISPVVVGSGYAGVGLFSVRSGRLAEGVEQVELYGGGLLYAFGTLSFGLSRLGLVIADSPAASFCGRTCVGQIALGAAANELASQSSSGVPEFPE